MQGMAILQQKQVKKDPSCIQCWDSNSPPIGHASVPITHSYTRLHPMMIFRENLTNFQHSIRLLRNQRSVKFMLKNLHQTNTKHNDSSVHFKWSIDVAVYYAQRLFVKCRLMRRRLSVKIHFILTLFNRKEKSVRSFV